MKLTTRQFRLHNLLKEHLEGLSIEEICNAMTNDYEYLNTESCHANHCPSFYEDRTALNKSLEIDKIIIKASNNKWKLATEDEAIILLAKKVKRARVLEEEIRLLSYKMKLDGQGKVLSNQLKPIDNDSKAKPFHEPFVG